MRHAWVLMILLLASGPIGARQVNSKEDLERLRGFGAHLQLDRDLERERLSDVGDIRKERTLWERQKNLALREHMVQRARLKAKLDESSPEFREDLTEKKQAKRELDQARRNFVRERDQRRREERATIALTEERELSLDKDPTRVDWKKRRFFTVAGGSPGSGSGGNSGGGGRFSGSAGGALGEVPPPEFTGNIPPPPPPDFYDAEPPPPPPPMDGAFPGGFDDPIPPPVFDDPPEF